MMWEWCNAPMDAALLVLEQEMNSSCDLEVSMNTYEMCWSLDAHGMPENFLGWVPGWFTDDLSSKPVFGQKQSNLFELVISKHRGWTTRMFSKDKNLICLQAIKVCPNVTPSYVLMRSNRRGPWWICNESKPLPAYTKGWWAYGFFWGFLSSLPNVIFTGFILNNE